MDYNHVPKIELHCHLDGSVRPETIIKLAEKDNIKLPSYDIEEIKNMSIAPMDCTSLDEYLKRFDLPLSVMQSSENIKTITFELMEDALFENVKYMEIRFAPVLHTQNGITQRDAIKAVVDGIKKAEMYFNIEANVILCCMKHLGGEEAKKTIEAGKEFIGKGVCAVDLAGGEYDGFSDEYKEAFDLADEYGYNITVHAGEAAGRNNVFDSIEKLHATRIGHGVRIADDENVKAILKEKGITLEICPTSNVQTKAVKSYEEHPIKKLMDEGIKITINTDNRTVSDTTMGNEYNLCAEKYGFGMDEFRKIYIDSVNSSFADDKTKERLMRVADQIKE